MEKRRERVRTQWIIGAPKREDKGSALIIRTFTCKRPYVATIVEYGEDDIVIRPAGESYDVVLQKSDITKYHVLSSETVREVINKCKKT